MRYRTTKKCECAHYYFGPRFLVTDDPYPIYNNECYCKAGRFDWTWGNHDGEELPCDKCKGFKISRQKIHKRRMEKKEYKERLKEDMKYDKYLFDHPEEREHFIDNILIDVF